MKHIKLYFKDRRHHLINSLLSYSYEVRRNFSICYQLTDISDDCLHIFVAWTEIIRDSRLIGRNNVFILHCGDLPKHRGWSPMTWLLKTGSNRIKVNLLTLAEKVDAGNIVSSAYFDVAESDDFHEISIKLANTLIYLGNTLHSGQRGIQEQQSGVGSYFRKLVDEDHDISSVTSDWKRILHAARPFDPERFPPFFEIEGVKYTVVIKKEVKA